VNRISSGARDFVRHLIAVLTRIVHSTNNKLAGAWETRDLVGHPELLAETGANKCQSHLRKQMLARTRILWVRDDIIPYSALLYHILVGIFTHSAQRINIG
jgi:hypothetical protein